MTPADAEQEGEDAAEEGCGLEPVEMVVHVCLNAPFRAGVPAADPTGRLAARLAAGRSRLSRAARAAAAACTLVATRASPAQRRSGGQAGPRDAAGSTAPGRALVGVAQQHGEPAQVDRHPDHGVEHRDRDQQPLPRADDRAQRDDLGHQADHPRRQPGQRQQGQAQRAAEQRVGAQQPGVCRERAALVDDAAAPRRGRDHVHHREGDEGRDDVGEQVAAATAAAESSSSADSGSTTHPAWATVDQASSRTGSSCTSARTLPSVIETAARMPMPTSTGRSPADERLRPRTSRAARAATFEVAARKAATGSVAPA